MAYKTIKISYNEIYKFIPEDKRKSFKGYWTCNSVTLSCFTISLIASYIPHYNDFGKETQSFIKKFLCDYIAPLILANDCDFSDDPNTTLDIPCNLLNQLYIIIMSDPFITELINKKLQNLDIVIAKKLDIRVYNPCSVIQLLIYLVPNIIHIILNEFGDQLITKIGDLGITVTIEKLYIIITCLCPYDEDTFTLDCKFVKQIYNIGFEYGFEYILQFTQTNPKYNQYVDKITKKNVAQLLYDISKNEMFDGLYEFIITDDNVKLDLVKKYKNYIPTIKKTKAFIQCLNKFKISDIDTYSIFDKQLQEQNMIIPINVKIMLYILFFVMGYYIFSKAYKSYQ
ncbi:MAG: hypothetical protein ACW98X_12075 [Promethearchaeota archaeon]|jgi:hypothetical protein